MMNSDVQDDGHISPQVVRQLLSPLLGLSLRRLQWPACFRVDKKSNLAIVATNNQRSDKPRFAACLRLVEQVLKSHC
jgi:hypothetical protein